MVDLAVDGSSASSSAHAIARAPKGGAPPRLGESAILATPDLAVAWTVLRARQWVHFVLVPAIPLTGEVLRDPRAAAAAYLPAAAVAALCLAYAYGLNAIADRHDDLSVSKNPLIDVERVPVSASAAVAACAVGAVALAGAASSIRVLPAVLSVFWASLYSAGPRLKRWPLWSTLTNCGIFAPLAFLIHDRLHGPNFALLTATFVAVQTQAQLIHEVADLDEDRRASVRSSAVAWGGDAMLRAASWLGVAVAGGLLLTGAWTATRLLAAATVSVAVGVLRGGSPADADRLRSRHRQVALLLASLLFLSAVLGA